MLPVELTSCRRSGVGVRRISRTFLSFVVLFAPTVFWPSRARAQQGTFVSTGSLNVSRAYGTATLLSDGKVLVAGGYSGENGPSLQSAEIYDPATGAFTMTGNMTSARVGHTATLLGNGKVLIAGGNADNQAGFPNPGGGGVWNPGTVAELYDPSTGTFTATGVMVNARILGTATLLSDGKVLLASGQGCSGSRCPAPTAELYDPDTGTFTATGNMTSYGARPGWTAALMNNGKVLFVGAYSAMGPLEPQFYDP